MREYRIKRKEKSHDITATEWDNCKLYFNYSCAYCGMAEKEHKLKYKQQLHKEHVDPNGANDLRNCVPACKICNVKKHDSNFYNWYTHVIDGYTDTRKLTIERWLKEDYKNFIKNL